MRVRKLVHLDTRMMTGDQFLRVGLEGVGLFLVLLMWSRSQETDGHIPSIMAYTWLGGKSAKRRMLVESLVSAGLLNREGDDFVIVGYSTLNDTRADLAREQARVVKRVKAAALRGSVIQRDGLWCHLCGGDVEPHDVHVDHVVPLSRGGDSSPENLKVSHSRCNLLKGSS